MSNVTDEVRKLDNGLVNVNSNLAQKENILNARRQASISNFQSDIGTKIENLKMGNISDVDLSTLNKLQAEINEITANTEDAEQKMRKFNIAFKELAADIKRGKLVDQNPVDININSGNEELKSYIANLKKVEAEHVQIQNSSRITYGNNAEQIRIVNALVSDGAGGWEKYQYAINATSGQVRELDKGLKETNVTTADLGNGVKRLIGYFVSFQAVIGLVRQAFGEMKNVDTEMVTIQKVSGRTAEEMKELAKEAYSVGSEFGRSASEYLSGVAKFSQGGYGELADELGKLAMLTQNAGDVNADTASKYLISADAAWKLNGNVSELTKILDGMNEIANKNTTNVQSMAEGINVAGSVFANAGLSAKVYSSIIGTATAITQQSGTEMARAWKTILMTLRQVKGTTDDGGIIDEAEFKKAGQAIEGLGVKMTYIDNGTQKLRPTIDILNDLAAAWGELNAEGRNIKTAELQEALGGKLQANALTSVLDNWDKVLKMQNEYFNASGSAARENEIYMQSWQAKTEQLKNTWVEFVAKTVDTNWVKGGIDGLTSLISLFDNLGNTILLTSGAILIMKRAAIGSGLETLYLNALSAGDAIKALLTKLLALIPGTKAHAVAQASANTAMKVGAVSASALSAALGIGLIAITGVVMAINSYNQAQIENNRIAAERAKKARDEANSISELITKYQSLKSAEQQDDNTRTSIKNIQDQITNLVGRQANNLDLVNGKLDDELQKLKEIDLQSAKNAQKSFETAKLLAEDEAKAGIAVADSPVTKLDPVAATTIENAKKKAGIIEIGWETVGLDANGLVEYYTDLRDAFIDLGEDGVKALGYISKYLSFFEEKAKNAENATKDFFEASAKVDVLESLKTVTLNTQESFDKYVQSIKNSTRHSDEYKKYLIDFTSNLFPQFSKAVTETGDVLSGLAPSISNYDKLTDAVTAWNEAQTETEKTYRKSQIDDILKNWLKSIEEMSDAKLQADAFKEYEDALKFVEAATYATESLIDKISEINSAYSTVKSAVEEYNEKGAASADTTLKLLELGDEYLNYLFDENGNLVLNEEAFRNLAIAKLEDLKASKMLELQGLIDDLREQGKTVDELKDTWLKAAAAKQIYADPVDVGDFADAPQVQAYLNQIKLIEDAINGIRTGKTGLGSSSKSTGDAYKEAAEKEFKDLKHLYDLKQISEEEYLNRSRALNEKYYKNKAKYLDDYRKYELEYMNGMQNIKEQKFEHELSFAEDTDNYDRQKELYAQMQDNMREQAQRYRDLGFQNTDIEIMELQKKYRAYGQQIEKVNEEIVQSLSDEFQKAQKVFDKELSKLDFKLSITEDGDYEAKEKLIAEQIENRIGKSQELADEMAKLQLSTDENVKATDKYKDLMESLNSTFDDNIKAVYELVKAQKSLAEEQISSVKDLQEKVIAMKKAGYEKEAEILKMKYDLEKEALDKQKELIKEKYDSEVKLLDETLKQMKKVWDEEDRRAKKKKDEDDVNEIQKRINELQIAADSGDAEAISTIEDLKKQLKDKQDSIESDAEKERRQAIEDSYADQKEALQAQYDLQTKDLEARTKLLDEEYQKDSELINEKLKNANLYAEARLELEKGLNKELIAELTAYEDEFGAGMGILGEHVKDELRAQLQGAVEDLKNLSQNIELVSQKQGELEKITAAISSINAIEGRAADIYNTSTQSVTPAVGISSASGLVVPEDSIIHLPEKLLAQLSNGDFKLDNVTVKSLDVLSINNMDSLRQLQEENMRNLQNALSEGSRDVKVDLNISTGDITQEVLPKVEKIVNNLKAEIPDIVAKTNMGGIRRRTNINR